MTRKKGVLWHLFLLLLVFPSQATPATTDKPGCPAEKIDEYARVRYVHDGDTLRLTDGRKIRLIGINAPELARKNKPEQAYARASRDRLLAAVASHGQKVGLVYGRERKDRYGRTLAHLFLENGTNLQAMLINEGLAIAYVVPPNDGFAQCYARFEQLAQCENRRIWSQKNYANTHVTALHENARGFHRLHGKVLEVKSSQKGYWLIMENNLRVQIRKQDLKYFDITTLESFKGRFVQVRGWLHPNKTGYYLSVRHPGAIAYGVGGADNVCQL